MEILIFQKEKDNLPTVPLSRIMKMNSTEWPFMLAGAVGSAIQGTIVPLYAIMFGEVLGVRPALLSIPTFMCIDGKSD